jgi:hypothetical protein
MNRFHWKAVCRHFQGRGLASENTQFTFIGNGFGRLSGHLIEVLFPLSTTGESHLFKDEFN